jgi:hypothetical protein
MVAFVSAFLALMASTLFFACAASSNGTFSKPDGSTPADPQYCEKYCQAELNAGTLSGSLEECLAQCCETVPTGCEGVDGGEAGAGGDSGSGEDASGAAEAGDGGGGEGGCSQLCGTTCCQSGDVCIGGSCVQACTAGSQCPTSAPCCAVQSNGQSGCVAATQGEACRCTTSADCTATGCCAPLTNSAGDPVGPYVCKADDGNAYDCCTGVFTTCGTNYCCVTDTNGNEFCAAQCTSSSTCGSAHCDPFTFGTFTTTCSGPTACGP